MPRPALTGPGFAWAVAPVYSSPSSFFLEAEGIMPQTAKMSSLGQGDAAADVVAAVASQTQADTLRSYSASRLAV